MPADTNKVLMNLLSAPATERAPPLSAYPYGISDIEQARAAGFDYGSGMEAYLNADVARRLPRSAVGMNLSGVMDLALTTGVTPHDPRPKGTPNLGDVLYAAAIAARRNPIAALGFDPSRITFEPKPTHTTTAGLYSPDKDLIYANPFEPSAVLHESVHRGFDKLRLAGEKTPSNEESAVRWLMSELAGDPETKFYDEMGFLPQAVGRKEVELAKLLYTLPSYREELSRLTAAAQRLIAAKPLGHQ